MSRQGYGGGSISQRTDGRWMVRVDLGRDARGMRQRKSAYAPSEAAAQKILRALTAQQVRGQVLTTSAPTLAEFLTDEWLVSSTAKKWRPSTRRAYRHAIDAWIVPDLGRVKLDALTRRHIQQWLSRHQDDQGEARRRIALAHATLRSALGYAQRLNLVPVNVAEHADVSPKRKKAPGAFTPAQAQAFLAAAETHRLAALFHVALACGLRLGEATGLAWATPDQPGIDLATGTIDVVQQLQRVGKGRLILQPLKTEKSTRRLELPAFAVAELQAHRKRQLEERLKAGAHWVENGLAFTTYSAAGTVRRAGRPLDPRNVARILDRLLVAAALPRVVTFHGLRHSAASLLLAKGVPLVEVSQLLGHSGIRLTSDIYGHLQQQTAARAARVMDEIFK